MRTPKSFLVLFVAFVAFAAFAAACVDGTTPDCSKVSCGTPTSDSSVLPDAQGDARIEAGDDAGDADAARPDAATDSGVDAKTD